MKRRSHEVTCLFLENPPWWREKVLESGYSPDFRDPAVFIDSLKKRVPSVVMIESDVFDSHPGLRNLLTRNNIFYITLLHRPITELIVSSIKDGAFDVLSGEDSPQRWKYVLDSTLKSAALWQKTYGINPLNKDMLLLGDSEPMQTLRHAIEKLGATNTTVLLHGPSGSGKEKAAEALHKISGRKEFVAINCTAIPKDLLEAELFGAQKGSFTGSLKDKPGLVEQADGGTLFLDEIGELELSLQPKLLRFLETRKARRVGSNQEYQVDVRIISATNADLSDLVHKGLFRADLYYRISELLLNIPPLKARLDDLGILAHHFMKMAGERFGKYFDQIEPALIERFRQYDWPGNIRELKSVLDRLIVYHQGPIIRADWWNPPQKTPEKGETPVTKAPAPDQALMPRKRKIQIAQELLRDHPENPGWVAAQLGIHPSTLFRWKKAGKISL